MSPIFLEIQNLIDIYPMNIEYTQEYQYINYRICNVCNYEMEVDSIKSELICNNCAMIKPLIGISFENIQFCNYDSQKSKSGTFNPNRHFHTWWSHILAKEDESEITNNDPDNDLFEKLHFIIKRDKKVLRFLTVIDIRNMLRELKRSELNKNISLILKKITGIGPPSISEEIEIRVENLFNKVIETCENIKRGSRTNRNYYPTDRNDPNGWHLENGFNGPNVETNFFGSRPTAIYRQISDPKYMMWRPDQMIGGIDISYRDDAGNLLYMPQKSAFNSRQIFTMKLVQA
jgi:hypothetical protein